MPKVPINARIPEKLKQEITVESKKRGMNISKFIETALIHELNRKSNAGVVHELEDINRLIQDRINDLKKGSNESTESEVKSIDYYIREVARLQSEHGRVSEGVISKYAKINGLTFNEFLRVLLKEGLDIIIM